MQKDVQHLILILQNFIYLAFVCRDRQVEALTLNDAVGWMRAVARNILDSYIPCLGEGVLQDVAKTTTLFLTEREKHMLFLQNIFVQIK